VRLDSARDNNKVDQLTSCLSSELREGRDRFIKTRFSVTASEPVAISNVVSEVLENLSRFTHMGSTPAERTLTFCCEILPE
jgi:hypothetical protein